MPLIIALCGIPDFMKNIQTAMIKALGMQNKALKVSFFGNWVVCLSMMYLLLGYGLKGIWLAKLIADVTMGILNYNLVKFDHQKWTKIASVFYQKRQS